MTGTYVPHVLFTSLFLICVSIVLEIPSLIIVLFKTDRIAALDFFSLNGSMYVIKNYNNSNTTISLVFCRYYLKRLTMLFVLNIYIYVWMLSGSFQFE